MSKIQLNAAVIVAIFLLVMVGVGRAKPLSMTERPKTDFERIPMKAKGWVGHNGDFNKETYAQLPSASLLYRFYEREYDASPVGLAIVYGTDLGDFHQPEVCLEGQGLKRVSTGKVQVKDGRGGSFEAVSLVTEADYQRQVFVYWFYTDGLASTSLGSYKLKILGNRLFMRQVHPSAMIRMNAVVINSEEEALEQVVQFANDFFPYLQAEFDINHSPVQ